jgi:hypothetical protein
MPAIKVIHTKTTDAAWDGGEATKNLKTDQEEAYYRQEFAWQDPDGDPTKKAAYKFPHHLVDADGAIGDACVKACQSIISVLNGGMGGADIPDKDRQGVWNHAAAHLKDAGEEPAELKNANPNVERRSVNVQLRADMVDEKPIIEGVAAVYNQETTIGGMFREIIQPGSFASVLASNPDVIAANNHDWVQVLGRTKNGTLRLSDQPDGLHYVVDINPDDPEAMSLYAKVQRGDIDQSSFAFTVRKDQWEQPEDKNILPLRTIFEYDELIDVSPVTFPAYPQTSAAVRSKLDEFQASASHDADTADGGSTPPRLDQIPMESSTPGGAEDAGQGIVRAHMAHRRRMLDLIELN